MAEGNIAPLPGGAPAVDAPTKRAVVYLRVSTNKQADKDIDPEGYSLPAQREACYRRAAELDAEVVAEYIDRGESAKTADRPSFLRMVERVLTERDVDYVILDKVNRFARNRRDDANVLFELRTAGCQLISVKENIDATPAGSLMHGILATIAEYESRNNGAEALKGMTRKAQVGGTPGRAPLGYLNVTTMVEGRPVKMVEPDTNRAPLVRWAFEAYASGEWSVNTLTEALVAKGLTCKPQGRRDPSAIHKSQVAHMLGNRYYIGYVSFRGVEYEGRHEPIVRRQVFDEVQAIRKAHDKAGERQRVHHHYLKGSVYCDGCKFRLCLNKSKGKYLHFFCVGRHSKRTFCLQQYAPAAAIEETVVELYQREVVMKPEDTEVIRQGIRAEVERQRAQAGPDVTAARTRLASLEQERRRLARGVVDGSIPGDLGREEQDRITREIREAKDVVALAEDLSSKFEDTLNRALDLVEQIDEIYANGDGRTRRLCNQFFFDHIWIRELHVADQEYAEPWATFKSPDFLAEMRRSAHRKARSSRPRSSNKNVVAPPAGAGPVLRQFVRLHKRLDLG